MEYLFAIAIAALVAVVFLAIFGKGIRIFGLRISLRGMTVNFERKEDRESSGELSKERKQTSTRLDELQNPWDKSIAPSLPEQKDPPPNNLMGKQFMEEEYTSSLIASLERNYQEGDHVNFDDGISQELEEG
ncbi:hypothetical protein AMR42_10530 [Limnothrix sp. PR1529]|uniref:hypothetical protein n=1 Tax=Limnothrix sp. PR1529 TaxID=1704291 RepID=UPI00081EC80F|nr:hypothetical protein [Limnothrix sp. PR1529]OCQ91029.1 hypothetical protein BCR12_13295 [Limnothrix sp. P13C2]PIB10634.1 hypothetical protein AMR42_10530 [Limnothrix sp. PR1529]